MDATSSVSSKRRRLLNSSSSATTGTGDEAPSATIDESHGIATADDSGVDAREPTQSMLQSSSSSIDGDNNITSHLHSSSSQKIQPHHHQNQPPAGDDALSSLAGTSSVADGTGSNKAITITHQQQQQLRQQQQQQQQPEGWRVKLYRLNQDGSWDDCGTGRILCIYENTDFASGDGREGDTSSEQHKLDNDTMQSDTANDSTRIIGYATLCVRSEVQVASTADNATLSRQQQQQLPKVLLRTRILLQDTAYQRQGDNIITWYEPFYNTNENENAPCQKDKNDVTIVVSPHDGDDTNVSGGGITTAGSGSIGGVDLALSFQDNCGCLEIWEQIIAAQGRQVNNVVFAAAAAAQRHHQQQATEQHEQVNTHSHRQQRKKSKKMHRGQHTNVSTEDDSNSMLNVLSSMGNCIDSNSVGMGSLHVNVGNGNSTWDAMNQQHYDGVSENDSIDMLNQNLEQQIYQSMSQQQQQQLLMNNGNCPEQFQLPSPPSIQNLDDIADAIASLQQQHHLQQRELLSLFIIIDECSYYKQLLDVFYTAESNGNYTKLATLAACIKTILLLNDPTILELTITNETIFDQACACLEYDPDLREKANHRWFLRERVKFRTVVPMNDVELQQAIHRTFRVQYLRDTLLRPTMDESSLSTLSSLHTFTHADVIKGVTMPSCDPIYPNTTIPSVDLTGVAGTGEPKDSYLVRVIQRFGIDLYTLRHVDWVNLESPVNPKYDKDTRVIEEIASDRLVNEKNPDNHLSSHLPTIWKQHLTPQDDSTISRRLRRRDALYFLRELFQMVRLSLQQCDRDDFFAVICTLEIDLSLGQSSKSVARNIKRDEDSNSESISQSSLANHTAASISTDQTGTQHYNAHSNEMLPVRPNNSINVVPRTTNILSLLANLLLNPDADISEKGAALEILAGVAMHDATLIRRHSLDCSHSWKVDRVDMRLPVANKSNQVVMLGPSDDLLSAFVFLLSAETDAGVLLQVSEIMRIILDMDAMGDQNLLYPTFADEAEGILPGVGQNPPHDQHNQPLSGGNGPTNSDQTQFFSFFYEYYAEWLVAPFQHMLALPVRCIPDYAFRRPLESSLMQAFMDKHEDGIRDNDSLLKLVSFCPVRMSFTVELLSFCVRAHLCRMKTFLLKSRVIGNVLQLLQHHPVGVPGDRCLKLSILRFLRAVLSVNDESYHRHIIQHNLFAYVFEAFRANPVGDNLVSSAVVEMCDFIHSENIKCLLDYIGRRHLIPNNSQCKSLEDVSSPYVSTITTLRKAYEANIDETYRLLETGQSSPGGSRYFPGGLHFTSSTSSAPRILSGKALEDQRKFQEKDDEESYFDLDDDEGDDKTNTNPVELSPGQEREGDLHRTPRMFSLTAAPYGLYHHSEGHNHDMN